MASYTVGTICHKDTSYYQWGNRNVKLVTGGHLISNTKVLTKVTKQITLCFRTH